MHLELISLTSSSALPKSLFSILEHITHALKKHFQGALAEPYE